MRYIIALVTAATIVTASPAAAERVATSLNCRAAPSTDARIVERLGAGESVDVIDRKGSWAQLDRPADCWASERYVQDEATFAARPSRYLPAEGDASNRPYKAKKAKAQSSAKRKYASSTASSRKKRRSSGGYSNQGCPCRGSNVCIGPRGGRYCITSGGNKRYGV